MKLLAIAVAVEAVSLSKLSAPERISLAQETVGDNLTVLQMLTNLRKQTNTDLSNKQTELATKRESCATDISNYQALIASETQNKALESAASAEWSAKLGALEAKCAKLEDRKTASANAQAAANQLNTNEKTTERNDQQEECNTLESAMTVLTNKDQTVADSFVQSQATAMSSAQQTQLYEVISRETSPVDADTVMIALKNKQKATGFGTIVGIVMGLHNHCLEKLARINRELDQLEDHQAEQKSLTEAIKQSDTAAHSACVDEKSTASSKYSAASSKLTTATTNLAANIKSLADTESACNNEIPEMEAYIRNHKQVVATVTEVLAILDDTLSSQTPCASFADETKCNAAGNDADGNALCEWDATDSECLPGGSGASSGTTTSAPLGFVQLAESAPDGPAHSHATSNFGRVCAVVNNFRRETERSKAQIEEERAMCRKVMKDLEDDINAADTKHDALLQQTNDLDSAIRDTGDSSGAGAGLNQQIDVILPETAMNDKVILQTASNTRKDQSSSNADEIAKNNRYIQQCNDAVLKLKKHAAFAKSGANATDWTGNVGDIIEAIKNLRTDAKNAIALAERTETTQHTDYMQIVANQNQELFNTMKEIARLKGERAAKLSEELQAKADLASVKAQHEALKKEFQATCEKYSTTNGRVVASGTGVATWTEDVSGNNNMVSEKQNLMNELDDLYGRLRCSGDLNPAYPTL